jgi:hypothetical protein
LRCVNFPCYLVANVIYLACRKKEETDMKTTSTIPEITGHGMRRDGVEVYTVASRSDSLRWWLVSVGAQGELTCDCPAGRHHRGCAHRGAVAAERRMTAAQFSTSSRDEVDPDRSRESSLLARPRALSLFR